MDPQQQTLLDEIALAAAQYRVLPDGSAAQAPLRQGYLDRLAQLHALGWQSALGEANELPDAELPADYLVRRARILDELEIRLGQLAMRYRDSRFDADADQAVAEYEATMDEMFRIGHWSGFPDPDSELPDRLMPASFHRHLERRARRASRADPAAAGGRPDCRHRHRVSKDPTGDPP